MGTWGVQTAVSSPFSLHMLDPPIKGWSTLPFLFDIRLTELVSAEFPVQGWAWRDPVMSPFAVLKATCLLKSVCFSGELGLVNPQLFSCHSGSIWCEWSHYDHPPPQPQSSPATPCGASTVISTEHSIDFWAHNANSVDQIICWVSPICQVLVETSASW